MTRDWSFGSTVVLPRMSAPSALAVSRAVLTAAAAEQELPDLLANPRKRLASGADELEAAIARSTVPAVTNPTAWPLDRRIDTLLGRQRRLFEGWDFDEPENDRRQDAVQLWQLWYGAGPWYTDSSYHAQWAEMTARFGAISSGGLEAHYARLGATVHLDALRRLHAEYGKILGITEPAAAQADDPSIAAPLDALKLRMREWIGKVEATVDDDVAGSRGRADRLLHAIATWSGPAAAPQPATTSPDATPTDQPTA